jgi:hypothetical protein
MVVVVEVSEARCLPPSASVAAMLATHAVEALTRCRDGAAVARARSGVCRLSRDGGAVVVVKVMTRCDGQRSRSVPIQDRCR